VQLSKRPGGLWAPAVAYQPVDAPPLGGGGSNNATMHMICPKLDTRNPSLNLGGFSFAAFGWKLQQSKVVTVDDHTRAVLHDATSSWKPSTGRLKPSGGLDIGLMDLMSIQKWSPMRMYTIFSAAIKRNIS